MTQSALCRGRRPLRHQAPNGTPDPPGLAGGAWVRPVVPSHSSDDEDVAARELDDADGHRPEDRASEKALAATSDDDEIGIGGSRRLQNFVRWVAFPGDRANVGAPWRTSARRSRGLRRAAARACRPVRRAARQRCRPRASSARRRRGSPCRAAPPPERPAPPRVARSPSRRSRPRRGPRLSVPHRLVLESCRSCPRLTPQKWGGGRPTGCAAARMGGGKLERLRHATQRTHPGRGCRERDLHVIVPVSAPATPKQTARDEARARAPEHARGLP